MTITWKDIVPDFLVFMIPVLAGILLLIQEFTWTVLILIIALLLLGFLGNALVRGQLACRYCKQRETGCPAAQLFDTTKKIVIFFRAVIRRTGKIGGASCVRT